ncbi:hypothetical protein JYK02_10115 [Corallococcus macrosporus]|uniref:Outer membrane protein beta-barrel domain-containing protein n=1 Tax=Corallococcus macrosporus TaxID=35 RepID=A0ABS3D891_9BACT|nr:hypothetical protein [Corallococcus macrosporus]MBN8227863.1 hypothetical protein [Corallococcus macrosporus]
MRRVFPLAGFFALACACGLPAHVRPVPAGSLALEAGVGGPAVRLEGTPVPLPLSTLGASYGLNDRWDVSAHAHLTPLLLGVAGMDVGTTWLALEQDGARPAVALTGRGYVFSDLDTGALFHGEATAAASWLLRERFLTYVSGSALYDVVESDVLWSLAAGTRVPFGRFALQLELGWYGPDYDASVAGAEWLTPGGHGALGLVLGGSYRFGGP